MKVSVYRNIIDTNVKANVSVDHILNYIKKNPYGEEVRSLKKTKRQVPVVTWAGTCYPTRSNNNFKELSGMMYFDIDTGFDKEEVFQIPEVFATWTSISGKGLGFLIKTEGLTKENFNSTYQEFIDYSSLPLDVSVKDISRCNIISKDEKILVKNTSKKFKAIEPKIIKNIIEIKTIDGIEYCRRAIKYANKKGLSYIIGMRDSFCFNYFLCTNAFGIDMSSAICYLYDQGCFSYNDFKIETKAKEIYDRYRREFGKDVLRSN